MSKRTVTKQHEPQTVAACGRALECAPNGGHLAAMELTKAAGLSEDESHGQTAVVAEKPELKNHGAVWGLERTCQEFQELLKSGGFTMTEVIPTRSPLNIIVGQPISIE
jgi:hypothetical protein